ncbi:MAG TPA: hypothetical protein VGM24_11290 [Puia sp.]
MAKKVKQHSQKSIKKTILKDIEGKLAETLKEYRKKVSEKKFKKSLRKAGKILGNSVTIESIAVVPKKQSKSKKTTTNAAQTELVS